MKAVVIPQYGGPEVLRFVEDQPEPGPGPDAVVLPLPVAGINHPDLTLRQGVPTSTATTPPSIKTQPIVRVGTPNSAFNQWPI